MRRQNKKWVGWGNGHFYVQSDSESPLKRVHTDENGSARRQEDQRRGSSGASPQAAHDDDEAPGQAPLAEVNARTPSESDAGGVGAGTLSTDGTPPYLTQFFFHAEAANSGIQFYNFSSKTQSPSWMQSRQLFFEKSFRIA
jgi:hypothetical protein